MSSAYLSTLILWMTSLDSPDITGRLIVLKCKAKDFIIELTR